MKIAYYFIGFLLFSLSISAQPEKILVVRADKIIAPIQPTMWGVFFEDINLGADGGMYAELIKNRSFEFTHPLLGWTINGNKLKEGDILVINRQKENKANQRFLRVSANSTFEGDLFLINEGFRGMGIKKNFSYSFSLMSRQISPGIKIHIGLI